MGTTISDRRRLLSLGGVGLAAAFGIIAPGLALRAMPAYAQTASSIQIPAPGTSPTVDAIKKAHTFRAGIAVSAPYLLMDPQSHQYRGAAITFSQAIAKSLGVGIEYVASNWDVIIAGLQANKFDAIMAPLFATPERKEVADFVNYASAGTCYVVLKTNTKLTDLESLDNPGVTVETYTGTGNEQGFVRKYPKARDYSITSPLGGGANVIDVLNERVDALVINSTDGVWVAEQYPTVKILPKDPEYCDNHPDIPFPVGMAYQKGDKAFGEFAQAVANSIAAEMDAEIVKYSASEFMKGQ
jgi:polar amino acid transport system substrate-binding protein